jgi:uncharacterized protein (TIGR00730 family)
MNILRRLWQCITVGAHLGREVIQILHGVYQISKLPGPCISIFGGSRLEQNNKYAQQAGQLADMLAGKGVTVLTGGGPGIMEAANCGVAHHRGPYPLRSLSFGMRGLVWEEQHQKCAEGALLFDYFFARKWLLINYSRAFCVFPGGLGTIDELSDLLNLMITQKLPHFPVVLIGTVFWKPYEEWLKGARSLDLIPASMEPPILITDDLDEALNTLLQCITREC